MTNENVINACVVHQKTAEACHFMQQTVNIAVVIFQLVQLTFKFGIAELSPFGSPLGFTVVGFAFAVNACPNVLVESGAFSAQTRLMCNDRKPSLPQS